MSTEDLAPELRAVFSGWQRFRVEQPLSRLRLRVATARSRPPAVEGVAVTVHSLGVTGYRLHTPAQTSGGALLWMHGGGFVTGSAAGDQPLCARLARRLSATVVSVDYRLAPRHPYPAALEDCVAVWDEVQRRAGELGIDPASVAVGGRSAGAGLAASLTQRLLDRGGVQPLAQWLSYAMLDDRTAADRTLDEPAHLVWDNRSNRFGWRSYLGRHNPALGYAVPARRTSLAGLPPAWIGVGELDLFHSENADYHRRLVEEGVDATLVSVPGAPHGFDAIAPETRVASQFQEAGLAWLAERAG